MDTKPLIINVYNKLQKEVKECDERYCKLHGLKCFGIILLFFIPFLQYNNTYL